MKEYLNTLRHVFEEGARSGDRTGVGTHRVFGTQTHYNLQYGFPAVTTKRLAWKAVVGELLWFLEGSTDERRLAELTFGKPRKDLVEKRTIWTDNADNQGVALGYTNNNECKELGPIYGAAWRDFGGVDQIMEVIDAIKTDPNSRRHIVTAWNPETKDAVALNPCHTIFQFYVQDNKLSCQLYQR